VRGAAIDVERPSACEDCGSPLAGDQRYCLECGRRVGARSAQLEPLLARVRGAEPDVGVKPEILAASPASAPAPEPAPARAASGLRLPPPRVSALLVLVFLGFGVLLGDAAASRVSDVPASARSPLKVVLPPSASASAAGSSSQSSSTGAGGEAAVSEPESAAEPTPAPSNTGTAGATSPSSSNAGSSGTEGSEGSAGAGEGSQGGSGSHGGSSQQAASEPAKKLPPFKHVFVIMLSDEPYASAFGPASTASYLTGTLEHKGELLVRFDAVAHEELADELALLSGQGPTAETVANCPNYTEIAPTGEGEDAQVLGSGCVYPRSTQTLMGELEAKHLTWRAYVQGTDEAGAQTGACAHPALGGADPTADQTASGGPYATFRNPFVYLGAVVDSTQCASDDVGLSALQGDLAHAKRTPSLSYIVPDRCHDGNPTPCTAGTAAGMTPADAFLKQVVPEITRSKAYKESGLLVITTDEAPSSGAFADSSSCCGQPLFPNAPSKTITGAPRGGGSVGALLLSPYVKGASTNEEPFNDFSLLRTIEDLFGLKHLGYASLSTVQSFEPAMFTAGKG
jgi:hypothetical protein